MRLIATEVVLFDVNEVKMRFIFLNRCDLAFILMAIALTQMIMHIQKISLRCHAQPLPRRMRLRDKIGNIRNHCKFTVYAIIRACQKTTL